MALCEFDEVENEYLKGRAQNALDGDAEKGNNVRRRPSIHADVEFAGMLLAMT